MKVSKDKPRKWVKYAVINLCLILLCAVVFGRSTFIVKSNAANYDTEQIQPEYWYGMERDTGYLHVSLRNIIPGYTWKYGISNDLTKEVHSYELPDRYTEKENSEFWDVYFTANDMAEGDSVLTFLYIADLESGSIDTRNIKVHCHDGKLEIIE